MEDWFVKVKQKWPGLNDSGAVAGPNYGKGGFIKYKSVKRKLEKFNFDKIEWLCGTLGNGKISYNNSISSAQHRTDSHIYFMIDEEFLSFDLEQYLAIAKQMHVCTKVAMDISLDMAPLAIQEDIFGVMIICQQR